MIISDLFVILSFWENIEGGAFIGMLQIGGYVFYEFIRGKFNL